MPAGSTANSAAMQRIKIGIIGGTGLDEPNILQNPRAKEVTTPWGSPSDRLILGLIHGVEVVLLARHGRLHSIHPSLINYRANIWALKEEGCTHVIVTNAVGSLREEMVPGDIVLMDQFFDRTTRRDQTFFDGNPKSPPGICHIPMAAPFCEETHQVLASIIEPITKAAGVNFHPRGTIVTIEGPRYSSKAESNFYRAMGFHLVGMTTVPEVVLANELGLSYNAIALVTDMDCWKEDAVHVTADLVVQRFNQFSRMLVDILHNAIARMKEYNWEPMLRRREIALRDAIMLPKVHNKDHPFVNPLPPADGSIPAQAKIPMVKETSATVEKPDLP